MLGPLLAFAIASAPAPRCDLGSANVALGPATAALQMEVYLDAGEPNLHTWLGLRRMAADYDGTLRIIGRLTAPDRSSKTHGEIAHWVVAAARSGRFLEAQRILHRDGIELTAVRLRHASGQDELARQLGISRAPDPSADECAEAILRANTPPSRSSLPIAALQGTLESSVEQWRSWVAAAMSEQQRRLRYPDPPRDTLQPLLSRSPVPLGSGATLGGLGLPHRLVIVANTETARLLVMLPRFMDDPRRAGHLAIQVVAEGEGLRMETLRQRLCAAQALDLVREYFDYLGTHSELEPRPDQQSVLARLDAFEKEECTPERSPPVQTRHMTLLSSAWWPHDLVPATSGLGSVTDLVQALHDGASPLTILLPTAPVSEASASQGDDPETD